MPIIPMNKIMEKETNKTIVYKCYGLKRWRKEHSISLRELEQRTGLSKSYLFKIEAGISKPGPLVAEKIMYAINAMSV